MATVKELFANAGVDNAELEAEIESLLTTAMSKKIEGIPKSRFKEKVDECNNLKADLAEKESEIDKLNKKIGKSDEELTGLQIIKKNYESMMKTEAEVQLKKWEERWKILDVDESDTNYERMNKIKSKFANNSEGLDKLKPEEIKANNVLFDVYDDAEYFKDIAGPPDGKKPVGEKPPKLNPFDWHKGQKGKLRDYGQATKMYLSNPELAKKMEAEAKEFENE